MRLVSVVSWLEIFKVILRKSSDWGSGLLLQNKILADVELSHVIMQVTELLIQCKLSLNCDIKRFFFEIRQECNRLDRRQE